MAFEILDTLSIPGDPAKPNDDALAHFGRAAVVMDGATGLGERLLPGPSDAAWIARFGANRLMAHLKEGAAAQVALKAALADAEKSFGGLARRKPQETYEIPFASMMLTVESAAGFDALWFGDCAALVKRGTDAAFIVGEAFDKKSVERDGAARLAQKTGLAPAAGVTHPDILPALRRARNHLNIEGGKHWVFGPDARAADHAGFARVAAPSGSHVLIGSDGFFALVSEYDAYDCESLMDAARSKGLAALGEELRAIEEADPEGRKYPRFKKSDDATALLLRMGQG
jgi:hypothetical protein